MNKSILFVYLNKCAHKEEQNVIIEKYVQICFYGEICKKYVISNRYIMAYFITNYFWNELITCLNIIYVIHSKNMYHIYIWALNITKNGVLFII